MNLKYKYICVDGSNLLWRNCAVSLDKYILLEDKPIYSTAIHGMLKKLKAFQREYSYEDSLVYILFDNPFSKINLRKILSSGKYKHTRQRKEAKYVHRTLNVLEEVLKCYDDSFRILRGENVEADDLTLPLKQYLKPDKQNRILYISADMDWARNIDEYCHWYNYVNIYNAHNFKKKYKFSPKGNSIKLYKAIHGDNSDCIKNAVPYLPENILLDIVERFEDVEDLYENLWRQDYPEKWKIKLDENRREVIVNYQLVDFMDIGRDIKDSIIKCKEDKVILSFWINKLELPFEVKIFKKKENKNTFFSRKRYKRI